MTAAVVGTMANDRKGERRLLVLAFSPGADSVLRQLEAGGVQPDPHLDHSAFADPVGARRASGLHGLRPGLLDQKRGLDRDPEALKGAAFRPDLDVLDQGALGEIYLGRLLGTGRETLDGYGRCRRRAGE